MKMDLITFFLQVKNQLQILHWQTESYAKHMAYGRIYDAIGDSIDKFIEVYQGKYGRIKTAGAVQIFNIDDPSVNNFIEVTISTLTDDIPASLDQKADTDLLSIRDEILSEFNTLKNLLTLK